MVNVAKRVRRDPSVVSRALKSIAETAPLLEKREGKWRITPLGRQLNRLTKNYILTQGKLISQTNTLRLASQTLPSVDDRSALLILGTQTGFRSSAWGPRNNPDAEIKIESILNAWRIRNGPLAFCQHLSKEKGSPLYQNTSGCEFIPTLSPRKEERTITKHQNSAFAGTKLADFLSEVRIKNVVLVGFSSNHCIDATARAAYDLGFSVFIVSDATAAFDRIGPDGKHYSGEVLHASTLATLHQEYATVIDSETLLRHLFDSDTDPGTT